MDAKVQQCPHTGDFFLDLLHFEKIFMQTRRLGAVSQFMSESGDIISNVDWAHATLFLRVPLSP